MQCKTCGQENLDGAQLCQRCGTTLKKTAVQVGIPSASIASRIPGALVLIAGVLVLVGIFRPWLTVGMSGEIPGFGVIGFDFGKSGWDMATGNGLAYWEETTDSEPTPTGESHTETYAILAFVGSILLLAGALWALATPLMRFAWATAAAGGALATVGCAWGWVDLNHFIAGYDAPPYFSSDYGSGWYLAMLGGIVGLITGIYAFRRSSETSY